LIGRLVYPVNKYVAGVRVSGRQVEALGIEELSYLRFYACVTV